MVDKTIPQLTDGSPAQAADEVPISRAGVISAVRVTAQEIANLASVTSAEVSGSNAALSARVDTVSTTLFQSSLTLFRQRRLLEPALTHPWPAEPRLWLKQFR
jgi:hypothetical protein